MKRSSLILLAGILFFQACHKNDEPVPHYDLPVNCWVVGIDTLNGDAATRTQNDQVFTQAILYNDYYTWHIGLTLPRSGTQNGRYRISSDPMDSTAARIVVHADSRSGAPTYLNYTYVATGSDHQELEVTYHADSNFIRLVLPPVWAKSINTKDSVKIAAHLIFF